MRRRKPSRQGRLASLVAPRPFESDHRPERIAPQRTTFENEPVKGAKARRYRRQDMPQARMDPADAILDYDHRQGQQVERVNID